MRPTKTLTNIILILMSISFVISIILVMIFYMYKYNEMLQYKKIVRKKECKEYIPVVVNDHDVLLIRGYDTIKLSLENPCAFQEEYVVYVTH